MGGSTVAQFLWQEYNETLQQTAAQEVDAVLTAVVPYLQAAISLYILIAGKKLLTNSMTFDEGVTRVVRAIMVVALLTPANFNTYITTAATQTIPDAITNAINGQQNLTGAQGFDALLNATQNFAAQLRAQAVGILYISDRITIWLAEASAMLLIIVCLLIWSLAQAAIAFVIPIGALVIPFYLFDATREFAMRWFGKLVSLFLVLAVSLMLGAFVVKQDATYMQQYGQAIAARAPDPGFSMNAGDLAFTGFGEGLAGPAAGAEPNVQATANIDASIDALWKVGLVFAYGAFLMSIMVAIALFIGMSSGFTATPAIAGVTMLVTNVGRAAMRGGRAASGIRRI